MRLVICRQCNHLSGKYDGPLAFHSCGCVPENVVFQFPAGYDHYRELDEHEAKFLADYVAEQRK